MIPAIPKLFPDRHYPNSLLGIPCFHRIVRFACYRRRRATIPVISLAMIAGDSYWLTLSNANDSGNSGSDGWDVANGGAGGPATCNFRQSGTNLGNCGSGGESFVLSSVSTSAVPEPSSLILLGSSLLGVAGVVRRRLSL
jgi:hypothetical protein